MRGLRAPFRWALRPKRWVWRGLRIGVVLVGILLLAVASLRVVPPPITHTQWVEIQRLGSIKRDWVRLSTLPRHVPLSAIAAEDANFCVHWGFDVAAIRAALEDGAARGASGISQQTAKNVFLWQDRSWVRKGLETGFTVLIEALWGKRRIIEVYLNVAEFDEGVFGIEAAARHHFGVSAAGLSRGQAARLMAVLPDPKGRSAVSPGPVTQRTARRAAAGAQTLATDGRGRCVG